MVDQIKELPERTKLLIMAQVVRGKKGEHRKILDHIRHEGYVRVRIDGEIFDINDDINLEKNKKHTIEVVIDRLVVREGMEQRLADSLETALKLGEGVVYVQVVDGELLMFSENFACVDCGISLPEITPRMFSFNNPYGACPVCMGLGSHMEFDEELVIPDPKLSVGDGVFAPLSKNVNSYAMCAMAAVLQDYGYDLDTPWKDMDKKTQKVLMYGSADEKFRFHYTNMFGENKEYNVEFEGVMPLLARRYHETDSDEMRESYENYMTEIPCSACHGARLKPETLSVLVGGKNIHEVTDMNIREAESFFLNLELTSREAKIAKQILKEKDVKVFAQVMAMGNAERARNEGDTVGGIVECRIIGAPVGLGEPMFGKFSAELAHAMFSLPAVKGFEVGDGFALAAMKGSEANDGFAVKNGKTIVATNHSGGIQGGITNGNDVVFRVAFKPIPSLARTQQTVNRAGEPCTIAIEGRHDVCALPRAVVLVEALAAMVTVDAMMMTKVCDQDL